MYLPDQASPGTIQLDNRVTLSREGIEVLEYPLLGVVVVRVHSNDSREAEVEDGT